MGLLKAQVMNSSAHVQDWMSGCPATLPPHASLADAVLTLQLLGRDCLPVVDGERLVGLLTASDARRALPTPQEHLSAWEVVCRASDTAVDTIMAPVLVSASLGESLQHALNRLRAYRLQELPVLDSEARLVGRLTLGDVLRATRSRPQAAQV